MDQEGRIATRYKCDKRAIAEYGGDKYPCMIRDLSSTGAAIEFPDHERVIPIKRGFNLIMPDDGLKLPCRVVWRRDYQGLASPNFGRFAYIFSLGGSMADTLAIALVALGLAASCSAIIIFKLNRHQRTQQASFEENLFEIAYHLAKIRRGETLRSEVTASCL